MDQSDGTVLCPLDGRRTTTEVWVKLFIVYFTTITAYCHLRSIRNEPILTPKLVFSFLVPLSPLIDMGLCLLALILAGAWNLIKVPDWRDHTNQDMDRLARLVFGVCAPASDREKEEEEEGLPQPNHARIASGWEEERNGTIQFGRLIVVLAFLAQCIGTICMYSRRRSQNAVTHADQLIFELACGGLLTAVLTSLFILRVPLVTQRAPRLGRDDMTALEQFIAYRVRDELMVLSWPVRLVLSGVRSFLYLVLMARFGTLWDLTSLGAVSAVLRPPSQENWQNAFVVGAFRGPMILTTLYLLDAYPLGTPAREPWPPPLVVFTAFGALISLWCVLSWLGSGFLVFLYYALSLRDVGNQAARLANWPVDVACPPELWSDPLASWVWMLA